MKIAIASTYLGQAVRGIESWARDLSAELRRRGVDVTLFKGGGPAELPYEKHLRCTNHTASLWKRVTHLTRCGGWRFGLGSPESLQQVTFGWRLVAKLRCGGFDVVHLQDAWLGRVVERARRMKLHRAKLVFMHGTEEDLPFLLRFQHVQEQTPWYLEEDHRHGLPADRRWFVVPSFVDCQQYCPSDRCESRNKFQIPQDRFVILDVAALKTTHKRLDWLIQEVAVLRQTHPNALLVLAGAPTEETPQVERLMCEALGPHGFVRHNVNRGDMPDLYRAADVVAHPSLRELFGLVFVEAMACGTPVVGHNFPATEWIIGHGGLVVDMERRGELASALKVLGGDASVRAAKAAAARQRALDVFETRRVVDQYVAMYRSVLKDNRSQAGDQSQ